MTNTDYVDSQVFLANIPAQFVSLWDSLEQEETLNTNKKEYTCFKQKVSIIILSGSLLKLIDQFTYLGRNISSTESDIDIVWRKWRVLFTGYR